VAGNGNAFSRVLPISIAISLLLVVVAISYRQTIYAYPSGGGAFIVAKENLGTGPGLVAAAALLTDYIMTVAVSIAGGIAAITSAYHSLIPHTVLLCVLSIALLAIVNLRGVRESGLAFSVPTYVFVLMMVALIVYGGYRAMTGAGPAGLDGVVKVDAVSAQQHGLLSAPTGFALAYLLIRGFAEGCAAMTGTEAISNGVMAFRQPAQKNAAITLGLMVTILAAFFLGTSLLARHYAVMPTVTDTVLSQLADHVFGRGAFYYVFQYSTFAILVLAANTAFADFPRLSGILANDGYMPRQLAARGDRLAFSNGIIALGVIAGIIVALFQGQTNALIPLYAVGVFVCFTLSQAGMVMHWLRSRAPGWRWKAALNGIGAAATGIVSIIQVVTKFVEGAWIVVLIIPLIILLLRKIHGHYAQFAAEVEFKGQSPIAPMHHTVVVPVNGITKAAAGALVYATAISDEVVAVYIEVDPRATPKMSADWEEWDIGVPLVVIPSPYRSVLRPLVEYVESLRLVMPGELVTVVVPQIVPKRWWEHLLHNKTAFYIRTAFLFKPNVVVTTVPFLLGHAYRLRDLFEHDDRLDDLPSDGVHQPAGLAEVADSETGRDKVEAA